MLADEQLTHNQWAIVTTAAFAVVDEGGEVVVSRAWHEIATGEWDEDRHVLTVSWVDGTNPIRVKTIDPAPVNFNRVFKERVDASVVYSESHPVPGGVLRGALRRTPTGELISQISSDGQLAHTPQLQQQIEWLEAKLWDFVGI